jgi:hypothetical protein
MSGKSGRINRQPFESVSRESLHEYKSGSSISGRVVIGYISRVEPSRGLAGED